VATTSRSTACGSTPSSPSRWCGVNHGQGRWRHRRPEKKRPWPPVSRRRPRPSGPGGAPLPESDSRVHFSCTARHSAF
jgi:hypothetical protein